MSGFPVHHQLPELTQTHVHQVSDAIQPSHPLSPPSPPAFNLSQHQGLFPWVSSSHQVAKILGLSLSAPVLSRNIQDWFPLGWTGWISLQSKGLSRVFSNTTVQKHQFFSTDKASVFLLMKIKVKVAQPCWTLCDPVECVGMNSPVQNTGVGNHSLPQGILPTKGWNPGPLLCRRILYQLSLQGSPKPHWQQRMVWPMDLRSQAQHASGHHAAVTLFGQTYFFHDPGSIPRSAGSPGEGNGNPLQYSCLGNSMDGGAW